MSIIFAAIVPHPPIIIPEIGKGEEAKIKKTIDSYNFLAKSLAESRPDTIIVITPHTLIYPDMFNVCGMGKLEGNFADFGFSEYSWSGKNDLELANEIVEQSEEEGIAALLYNNGEPQYHLDHGVMVPIYFFSQSLKKSVKILPIGYTSGSRAEHYMFGQMLSEICERSEKRVAIIASGDLSHHLNPEKSEDQGEAGKLFDRQITESLKNSDEHKILNLDASLIEAAGECGYRSIVTLLGAVSNLAYEPDILSYEGPFGVGYMLANLKIDKKIEY